MELRDHGLSEDQGLALLITLVLTAAGGYLFAWKAKERASRKLGMTLIVFVSGLLGCFFLAQAIGMLTDIGLVHSHDWKALLAIPLLLLMPTLCFAIAATFIRRLQERNDKTPR